MAKDKADPDQAPEPVVVPVVDPGPEMVGIVVTCDHVYLALDAEGNGRVDWASTSDDTAKVEKRARLQVPRDLGEMLSAREQAEII